MIFFVHYRDDKKRAILIAPKFTEMLPPCTEKIPQTSNSFTSVKIIEPKGGRLNLFL